MSKLTPIDGAPKKTTEKPRKTKQQIAEEIFAKEQQQAEFKRRVRGEDEVWHDLIRLETAEPRRNISFHEDAEQHPIWERIPHKHFYHTVDSDGKPQKYATPANGHTHEIKIIGKDEDGKPIVEVGDAVVIIKGKEYPLKTSRMDNHRHEASYIHSEKFKKRVYSEDFLKKQSEVERDMNKALQPPSGVK